MRVLVVEDSRTLADALAEGLQDEGFAVDVAYDGVQAATKLGLAGYDVVVLDRDLPGLHGDTVCRMITERDAPAMVLMLTASGARRSEPVVSASGPTTICPSHFTFRSSCSACARSRAGVPPRGRACSARQASSSTPCTTPRPVTPGRSASRARSLPCSRR